MSRETAPDLIAKLAQFAPVSSLPLERQAELAKLCVLQRWSPEKGEISAADWAGQTVYLLAGEVKLSYLDGSFDVRIGATASTRHPLNSDSRGLRACKPITEIELLRLDEELLDRVLAWEQGSARSDRPDAPETADWRKTSGMFSAQKLAMGAFAALPPANVARLLDQFVRVGVKRGETIVKEGEPGDCYYLIDAGRCVVTRHVGGVDMQIADLKPGDAFGEEALLSEASRNATVTMKTDGILLRLAKADFFELLREPLLNRIDLNEASRRVAAGAQWIDVRFPAEFVHDGLPGAINIPLNEVRRSSVLLDMKREYVAYCQSGRRSSIAAFLLAQRGLQASVLAGGLRRYRTPMPETVSR